MWAYAIIVFSILILGLLLGEWKPSRKKEILYLCISSVILIVFSSIRATNVGIDYFQFYVPFFENVHSGGWGYLISDANTYRSEFGFSLLTYLISFVTGNPFVYAAVIAVFMVGLTALVLYRDCPKPWVGMFIFVAFNFFGNTLSYLRQSLAIAIFLFAIRYIKEKRIVPYMLLVLLAASFHNSLLLVIPIYFLAQIPVNRVSMGVYAGVTVLVLIFSWQLFDLVTQFVYQYYATEQNLYFMNGRDFMTGFVPGFGHGDDHRLQKTVAQTKSKECGFGQSCHVCRDLFYLDLEAFPVPADWQYLLYRCDFVYPGAVGCLAIHRHRRRERKTLSGGQR